LILVNHEPHDYSRAFKLLGHIIDPVMYNNIGYLYEQGLGIHDGNHYPGLAHPTALDFYKMSANMCYGRAMYHIGRLYQSGVNDPTISAEPIQKNPDMARKWMEMAAHYGSSAAADWLNGEDKNNPNPEAAIEPELSLPVTACQQPGG
jgi:TPR repeat protein